MDTQQSSSFSTWTGIWNFLEGTSYIPSQRGVEYNPGRGDTGHLTNVLVLRHFSLILRLCGSHSNPTQSSPIRKTRIGSFRRTIFLRTILCFPLDPECKSKSIIQDVADPNTYFPPLGPGWWWCWCWWRRSYASPAIGKNLWFPNWPPGLWSCGLAHCLSTGTACCLQDSVTDSLLWLHSLGISTFLWLIPIQHWFTYWLKYLLSICNVSYTFWICSSSQNSQESVFTEKPSNDHIVLCSVFLH